MRALTAASNVSNIFGFTLSSLPTSILDAVSAVATDPAMRKSAIELAKAAANRADIPEQLRDAVSALLKQAEPITHLPASRVQDRQANLPDAMSKSGLTTRSDPLRESENDATAELPLPPPLPELQAQPGEPALPASQAVVNAVGTRIINQGATADTFVDRLRAYIPIEVLSFFITVNSFTGNNLRFINASTWLTTPTLHGWVSLFLLFFCLILIVLYTKKTGRQANTVWGVQASISAGAFLIWTYTMNASFYKVLNVPFDEAVSALCLGIFTIASGFIVPVKRQ